MRSVRPLLVALLCLSYFAVPTFARRAITVTEKLAGGFGAAPTDGTGTTTNLSSYTSAQAFTLASGSVGLCFFVHSDADAAETIATVTHNSTTWTAVPSGTTTFTGSSLGRISAFWKAGSQASSTMQVDITGADGQTGMLYMCYEVAGADTSSPIAQTAQTGTTSSATSHTLTLGSARTSGSALFFAIGAQDAETWTAEYAGVGTESTYGTPTTEARVQWDIGGADTTPAWTSGTTASGGFVSVEIKEAAAAGGAVCKGALMGVGCLLLEPR